MDVAVQRAALGKAWREVMGGASPLPGENGARVVVPPPAGGGATRVCSDPKRVLALAKGIVRLSGQPSLTHVYILVDSAPPGRGGRPGAEWPGCVTFGSCQ